MTLEIVIPFIINYGPIALGVVLCLLIIKFIRWLIVGNRPNHKIEVVQCSEGNALYINNVRVAGCHPTYAAKTIASFSVSQVDLKMGIENV